MQLLKQGLLSPHREARLRRRELRQRRQAEQEEVTQKMRLLQVANDQKQRQLDEMKKVLRHRSSSLCAAKAGHWDLLSTLRG